MSYNIKKYYEEYEKFFQKKNMPSNSNGLSEKQANVDTNKYNKSCQKEVIKDHTIIPFGCCIIKNNNQKNISMEDEIKMIEKRSFNLKKKKIFNPMKNITVREKVFYQKNGRSVKFKLFNENELGLNKFDNNVDILDAEEDYDSDDMIIIDGMKKAEKDLYKAIEYFKKNNFKDIYNYQKFCK